MSELRVDCGRQPSGWSYVETAHLHLLVRLDPDDPSLESCREAALHRGVDGVLDALLSTKGLAGLPDLAMVEPRSRRVVARGTGTVDAYGTGPTSRVRAVGRSPWVDVDVDDEVTRIELRAQAAQADAPEHTSQVPRSRPASTPAPVAGPSPKQLLDALASEPKEPAAPAAEATTPPPVEPVARTAAPGGPERPAPEESGVLPSYDHLFGETGRVPSTVPEPAAPLDEQDEQDDADERPQPPGEDATPGADPTGGLTLPPPTDTRGMAHEDAGNGPPAPEPDDEGEGSGLIASVPWRRSPAAPAYDGAEPSPVRAPRPVAGPRIPIPERPQPTDPPPEPDHREQPAAPPPHEQTVASAGADPELTVDRSTLPGSEPISGPIVVAVLCPQGHPSPPQAARCRQCGTEIPRQDPRPVPRPVLGMLRLSTGDTVTLDRGVLMGRSPRVSEDVSLHEKPNLLRLPSPQGDISRNHVEVVLDGWQVMVRDLGSTNGTLVTLPGAEPVRLRPQDLQLIDPGTTVALSPDVSFTYELEVRS